MAVVKVALLRFLQRVTSDNDNDWHCNAGGHSGFSSGVSLITPTLDIPKHPSSRDKDCDYTAKGL